eukprot:COSAG02_NODE_14092_length_1311_cov_2.068482_1_plen_369_part_01
MPYVPPHLRRDESSSIQPASGRSLADLEAKLPTVPAYSKDEQRGKARLGKGSYNSGVTLGASCFAAYICCSEGTHLLMMRDRKDRSPKIYFRASHVGDVGFGDTERARAAVLNAVHQKLGTPASPLMLQHMASVAHTGDFFARSATSYREHPTVLFPAAPEAAGELCWFPLSKLRRQFWTEVSSRCSCCACTPATGWFNWQGLCRVVAPGSIDVEPNQGETETVATKDQAIDRYRELLMQRGEISEIEALERLQDVVDAGANPIADVQRLEVGQGWETQLGKAAYLGFPRLFGVLVDQGADVNAVDAWGDTPLMVAAKYGHMSIVSLALQLGADTTPVSSFPGFEGMSAVDLAARGRYDGNTRQFIRYL